MVCPGLETFDFLTPVLSSILSAHNVYHSNNQSLAVCLRGDKRLSRALCVTVSHPDHHLDYGIFTASLLCPNISQASWDVLLNNPQHGLIRARTAHDILCLHGEADTRAASFLLRTGLHRGLQGNAVGSGALQQVGALPRTALQASSRQPRSRAEHMLTGWGMVRKPGCQYPHPGMSYKPLDYIPKFSAQRRERKAPHCHEFRDTSQNTLPPNSQPLRGAHTGHLQVGSASKHDLSCVNMFICF